MKEIFIVKNLDLNAYYGEVENEKGIHSYFSGSLNSALTHETYQQAVDTIKRYQKKVTKLTILQIEKVFVLVSNMEE